MKKLLALRLRIALILGVLRIFVFILRTVFRLIARPPADAARPEGNIRSGPAPAGQRGAIIDGEFRRLNTVERS